MKTTVLTSKNRDNESSHKDQFAMDLLLGLSSFPKSIPAKYFYDDKGSELFQKITQHPDYYPTRVEYEILSSMGHRLPDLLGRKEIDIIELGAGDGHKSQLVVQEFLKSRIPVNFYPIDISEQAMNFLEENIEPHPLLNVHGVVAEYFHGLNFVRKLSTNRQLVLFLGSNIGNFSSLQILEFLRKLWKSLNKLDCALIGFDLKKDIEILLSAYNDSAGHTQAFNLNLLERINRELGGNFDLAKFQHFGSYNPILGTMESYLLSTENQVVNIAELEKRVTFCEFEPIHLEYSFKFSKGDINKLAENTGFEVTEHFSDKKGYFVDSLWKVNKE